ncbi:hypothetical protein F2Q69_00047285 [Brassica cretica]|uniref:Uncharacterized protein n=1 Tax=Brassica cretica TaxID=69181 RepID=A0A8S9PM16_BRACR|nr:hypothetical protein F2Q69_00047285 [Brassica cretica]
MASGLVFLLYALCSSSNSIGTEDGYVLEPQGEHRVTIITSDCEESKSSKWCNVGMITDTTQDCRDELDSAAALFLLVIKGVGGVGQGAQVALNFAKWNAVGDHTMNMRLVIGINSWRIPTNRIDYAFGAAIRASWQSILLIRGNLEPSIPLYFPKETAVMSLCRLGPEITVSVLKKVEVWLNGKLPLDPN